MANLKTVCLFAVVVVAHSRDMGKCCPPGHVLQKLGNFSCILSRAQEPHYRGVNGSTGFPACEKFDLIPFSSAASFDNVGAKVGCVEVFREGPASAGYLAILHCQGAFFPASFARLKTCCRFNESYDFSSKSCRRRNSDEHSTDFPWAHLRGFYKLIRDVPKCRHALVDYKIKVTDLRVERRVLTVRVCILGKCPYSRTCTYLRT